MTQIISVLSCSHVINFTAIDPSAKSPKECLLLNTLFAWTYAIYQKFYRSYEYKQSNEINIPTDYHRRQYRNRGVVFLIYRRAQFILVSVVKPIKTIHRFNYMKDLERQLDYVTVSSISCVNFWSCKQQGNKQCV